MINLRTHILVFNFNYFKINKILYKNKCAN